MQNNKINNILIVSILPYFIDKPNFWFEKNLKKILEVRKTQSFFEDNTLYLEKNQLYNFSQFLRKLDEMGYERVFKVSEPGEFSQRGGLVDVFPISNSSAVRFDFLGNKIENIELLLDIKIENEKRAKELLKKKLKSQKLFSDLKNLKKGDHIVHLDHGIGIYNQQLTINNHQYYQIEYSQEDKLYVPLGLERKLSRYVGFVEPKISRLGSSLWQKTKRKIKEEVEKLAKELLDLYAQKEIVRRPPYLSDKELEAELVSGFLYEETPDQMRAIEDIKNDLKEEKPMDRIVCGDVGFGKTEVALRTAALAVANNKQTAMICPTTILASQHFNNFKKRLEKLPIKVSLLSRLQSKKEQEKIIKDLKDGKIDIVIGTHRLLSSDIEFKNLQLLIIDDEQKFGVRQKERLRKMKISLDVLSLSATPIPRTLYLALSSLKNMSLIQTPPEGRLSVKTSILPYNQKVIKKAIEFELKRDGQVYFLHNRIGTINKVKENLKKLVPKAKIGVLHAKLNETQLVKIMDDFQKEKINVLVATTIIENGLDLPKVNTLIVSDAGRLGLSQAHQIRGRIGRSYIQAFAYFLYGDKLSELSKLRLTILKKAESVGSGYRIALKDLEIRGAGNVLGKEQSGSVNRVGLNLYCQMLSLAVEKLKEQKRPS